MLTLLQSAIAPSFAVANGTGCGLFAHQAHYRYEPWQYLHAHSYRVGPIAYTGVFNQETYSWEDMQVWSDYCPY
jgi:hypothetical protein